MRLLTKNALVLLVVTLIVFTAGGFIFYSQLKKIMNEEAEEALYIKKDEVVNYIAKNNKLPESISSIELLSFSESIKPINEDFSERMIYSEDEQEYLPYKLLCFNLELEGKKYNCTISKSLIEADDLIETIFQSFMVIIVLLIVVFIVINFMFSMQIWKPFFETIKQINNYEVEKHQVLTFKFSGTKEFRQLNEAIEKMTQKISIDFNNLKSFTENASHELQTPLAIIKGKTELLLQEEGLSNKQAQQLIEINQTTHRLSRLNQTLLLMSKIENNQYTYEETVDFSSIVVNKLKQLEDLIEIKQLAISSSIENVMVAIHPVLADIIISNLLSNAIKYTPAREDIKLILNTSGLIISNNGKPLKAKGNELFTRFYKENPDSTSTGLGLALVNQIAKINNHILKYEFIDNHHVFSYSF